MSARQDIAAALAADKVQWAAARLKAENLIFKVNCNSSHGQAYVARCEGLTGSSTMSAEAAACRAAAKAFARSLDLPVSEDWIRLLPASNKVPLWLAIIEEVA